MLKKQYIVLIFSTLLLFWGQVQAQEFPEKANPPRLVNDYVGMLSANERQDLEQKLRGYADSTSTQITVVILKSTGAYPAGDYAYALGKRWGVGQKDKDNGILLLWATEDRKIFIATGRGMEGPLPDAICKRIVSQVLVPNFKNKAWATGLDQATTEIFRRATGEYKNENRGQGTGNDGGGIFFLLLVVVIVFLIIAYYSNKNGGGRNGGRRGYDPFPYIIMSSWGSSGGNWSGGNSSGNSSDGGGFDFGGFGGGDFGGGGAGGDY